MSCEIAEDHAPHDTESHLFGPDRPPLPTVCQGIGTARRHWLSMVGSVECACGWRVGKGVGQWQWIATLVERHMAEHPDGDFG